MQFAEEGESLWTTPWMAQRCRDFPENLRWIPRRRSLNRLTETGKPSLECGQRVPSGTTRLVSVNSETTCLAFIDPPSPLIELVGYDQTLLPIRPRLDSKMEGAAVGMASTPSYPVAIGAIPEAVVLGTQTLESGVYYLPLGGAKGDARFAFLVSKNLRPQHAGIGDTDQTPLFVVVLSHDEEPRAVRGAVHVSGLYCPVKPLCSR